MRNRRHNAQMYLMTAAMIVFLAGCNSGKKTRVVNAESIDAASFRDPDAPAAQARPVVVRTDTADHDESRNAVVALVGGPDEVEMARTAEGESETKPGSRPRVRTSDARHRLEIVDGSCVRGAGAGDQEEQIGRAHV